MRIPRCRAGLSEAEKVKVLIAELENAAPWNPNACQTPNPTLYRMIRIPLLLNPNGV